MKKIFTFILFFIFYQVALPQSDGFWMGDFIGSSESSNFRVLVNNSIYQITDTTWVKDVPTSPPNQQYVSADMDSSNNIWLFANHSIHIWNRKKLKWVTFSTPPIYLYVGKVFGKYVYCANSVSIYRADYTQPTISWQKVFSNSDIEDFYVHGKYIYIAIYDFKVLRAKIGNQNWETILTTPSSPATVVVTDSMIAVGTYWNGVYSSVNNGKTWVNGKGFPANRGAEIVKINKEDELYALQIDQLENTGWYYSGDKGKSFVKLNFNLSPWTIFQMRGIQFNRNNIYVNIGYRGFLKSNDHGKTWTTVNNGYNDCKPHHIKRILTTGKNEIIALSSIGGNPTPWYSATWGIFSSTDDGASWKEVSQKLQVRDMIIEDIVENEAADLIVAPYEPGVLYILKKDATEWVKINVTGAESTINELEKGEGDTLFAGTYSNGILRSSDGGYSWQGLDIGISISNHPYISHIFTKKRDVFTVVSGFGIYYSPNSGDTWQKINDDGINFLGIKSYEKLLFGYTTSKIYKSADMGNTWVDITGNLPNSIEIRDIDVEGLNLGTKEKTDPVDGTIFIASNVGVFQKTITMTSWFKKSSIETNCISYSKTSRQMLFGGVENLIKEDYNASSVATFTANSQMIPFVIFFSAQIRTIEVKNRSKTDHIKSVSLYNNLGQKLIDKDGLDNCNFNISGFPSGFYMVHVVYDGGRAYTKKLLVTR